MIDHEGDQNVRKINEVLTKGLIDILKEETNFSFPAEKQWIIEVRLFRLSQKIYDEMKGR